MKHGANDAETEQALPDNWKQRLGNRFRDRRFAHFEAHLASIEGPISIIDIGGTSQYWHQRGVLDRFDVHITLVNLKHVPADHDRLTSVVADATNLRDYGDGQFDIAFSNSVIEHVGDRKSQRLMALEIQRVGRMHYVQTPNKYFVIEPHFLLPYFQFFPRPVAITILTKTPLSRGHRWDPAFAAEYVDEIDLLSKRFLTSCFPSSQIAKESLFGFAKSYTAHNID
jgi:hypothetical protein